MPPRKVTRRSLWMTALGGVSAAGALWGSAVDEASAAPAPSGAVRSARRDAFVKTEDGRDLRISTWPAWGARRAVVLFSHGALSAPENYERVFGPWNAAGFEIMAPLHVDSTAHPEHAKYGMLDGWRARLLDMRALANVADASSFIAAGHSYGALVALALGGAAIEMPPGLTGPVRDVRASSVVALSPPGASPGFVTLAGYSTLSAPALIQTGDRDIPFDSKDGRWQPHLAAYEQAPAGDKYALMLAGVDHYFGGLICKFDLPGPTQDAQLTMAVSLATLFMDAYGLHDPMAHAMLKEALSKSGPVQLLRK